MTFIAQRISLLSIVKRSLSERFIATHTTAGMLPVEILVLEQRFVLVGKSCVILIVSMVG